MNCSWLGFRKHIWAFHYCSGLISSHGLAFVGHHAVYFVDCNREGMQTDLLTIVNELWSWLFPLFRYNQTFVCIDQQIKWTRNFQHGQKCHCCCDLFDHWANFILNSFLRLLTECMLIFVSLVTLNIKLSSFKELITFNTRDDYHQFLN